MRAMLLVLLLAPAASALPVKENPARPAPPGERPATADPQSANWGPAYMERLSNIFERVRHAIPTTPGAPGYYADKAAVVLDYFPREGQPLPQVFNGMGAVAFSPNNGLNKNPYPVIVATMQVFEMARTDDELAFMLAHEFGHLVLNHHGRLRDQRIALFNRWYAGLRPPPANENGLAERFMREKAAELDALQRPLEGEADTHALSLMAAAGFNRTEAPKAMLHAQDLVWANHWTNGGDHDTPLQRASAIRAQNLSALENALGVCLPPGATGP